MHSYPAPCAIDPHHSYGIDHDPVDDDSEQMLAVVDDELLLVTMLLDAAFRPPYWGCLCDNLGLPRAVSSELTLEELFQAGLAGQQEMVRELYAAAQSESRVQRDLMSLSRHWLQACFESEETERPQFSPDGRAAVGSRAIAAAATPTDPGPRSQVSRWRLAKHLLDVAALRRFSHEQKRSVVSQLQRVLVHPRAVFLPHNLAELGVLCAEDVAFLKSARRTRFRAPEMVPSLERWLGYLDRLASLLEGLQETIRLWLLCGNVLAPDPEHDQLVRARATFASFDAEVRHLLMDMDNHPRVIELLGQGPTGGDWRQLRGEHLSRHLAALQAGMGELLAEITPPCLARARERWPRFYLLTDRELLDAMLSFEAELSDTCRCLTRVDQPVVVPVTRERFRPAPKHR